MITCASQATHRATLRNDARTAPANGVAQGCEALLAAVAERRDHLAFAQLFDRFAPRIEAYLRRLGAEKALAEDLTQDVMLVLWQRAALYDPRRATASTWIFTIARNLCLDKIKMTRRHREVSMDAGGQDGKGNVIDFREALRTMQPAVEEGAEIREERARLMEALAKVTPAKREALLMRQFAGLSYQEIAAIVKAPVGTVKFRVHEAMQDLMKLMGVPREGRQADAV